jgi:hypothetical protein
MPVNGCQERSVQICSDVAQDSCSTTSIFQFECGGRAKAEKVMSLPDKVFMIVSTF